MAEQQECVLQPCGQEMGPRERFGGQTDLTDFLYVLVHKAEAMLLLYCPEIKLLFDLKG